MKLFIACFFCLFLLCACNPFGGQIRINDKSSVKFEGIGVSRKQATHLGQFLLQQGYFNSYDKRIVYLRKENNRYEVSFVIDKELFTSDKENLLPGLIIWQQWINEKVFPDMPTRLVLVDESRKTLHTIESKAPTH